MSVTPPPSADDPGQSPARTPTPDGAELDLLAFGAHPDDVELCCGGLLASSAARGYRTGIVDLSRGELSTSGTPDVRAEEATRAAEILGLHLRENLGFPDGFIHPYAGYEADPETRSQKSQLARVVSVLRRLRPTVVVIPWAHERHPDHEAAAALLTKAVFFAGVRKFATDPTLPQFAPFAPREVWQYPMRFELPPSFIVDVSAVVEQKAQAIAAHSSQLHPIPSPTPSPTPTPPRGVPSPLIGSPLTMEAFEARDRYYGSMIGVRAGEPYLRRAPMGLADPIAHFQTNGFPGALFFGPPR